MKKLLIVLIAIITVIIIVYTTNLHSAIQQAFQIAVQKTPLKVSMVQDASNLDTVQSGIVATGTYLYTGTGFKLLRGDDTNGAFVNVKAMAIANQTPSDNKTTPSDTIHVNSFPQLYNGTTWDMERHSWKFKMCDNVINAGICPTIADISSHPMSKLAWNFNSNTYAELSLEYSIDNIDWYPAYTFNTLTQYKQIANISNIGLFYRVNVKKLLSYYSKDVATDSVFISNVDLSIIPPNNMFIAYTAGGLKFIKSSDGGNTWTEPIVIDNVGEYSVSIDAVDINNIFIAYYDATNGNLKFAKSSDGGTTWTTMTVDSSINDVGQYSLIDAVDVNNIFIAYFDNTNSDLKFAKSSDGGNTWTTMIVDSAGAVGYEISMHAVDVNNIFISYNDFTNWDLKFAKSSDGGNTWTIMTVDSAGDVGIFTSIDAVDVNNIFISYNDFTNWDLKFAKSSDGGNTWTTMTVDSAGDVGLFTSIDAVDVNNIFISYYGTNLKVASSTNNGVSWNVEDTDVVNGEFTSIKAINLDTIYIAHHNTDNNSIRLTQKKPKSLNSMLVFVRD